jgi:hypothetical protein
MRSHRSRSLSVILALSTLGAVTAGCDVPPEDLDDEDVDDVVEQDDALIGGALIPETQYRAMVFFALDLGGGRAAVCSGAKVGPSQILTAGHCVATTRNGKTFGTVGAHAAAGATIRISPRNIVSTGTPLTPFQIRRTRLAPTLVSGCARGCAPDEMWNGAFSDMAIIWTTQPLPTSIQTARVKLGPVGGNLTITGFGCENANDPGIPFRAKKVVQPVANGNTAYMITNGLRNGGNASLCSGDSGGAVFRGASQVVIVGVNSGGAGTDPANRRTQLNVIASTSGARAWLDASLPAGSTVP